MLGMADKALERLVLEICRRSLPGFPQAAAADHESPDFLVRVGSRTIGIEMQEFIQGAGPEGAPARAAESTRAAIMRMAQRDFEASHANVHLYVYGHFRRDPFDRKLAPELAKRLAQVVATAIPTPKPGVLVLRRHVTHELETADLTDYLHDLDVLLYARATYGLWTTPEVGYSSRDLDDLNQQIQAKEPKVAAYRQACDEIWLVIYALALPSGGFDMDALAGARITSPFDHVLFVDAVSGQHALLTG